MVIAGRNEGLAPLPSALEGRGGAPERDSAETGERAPAHGAATRERLASGIGRPGRFPAGAARLTRGS